MEVWTTPSAGAADIRDVLPGRHPVTGLDRDAPRLEVSVDCEPATAEIEHHAISAGGLRGQLLPLFTHHQVRIPIDRFDDGSIGHREHGLAVCWIAGVQGGIAGAGPVPGTQLVEVNREPLREVTLAIDHEQGTAMRAVATASERGPAGSGEWRPVHDW